MPNRNRRRPQRENRSQAEDNSRRSRNPERRNEDPEEELPSAPRQLRTWDDLVAERQRQAAPHVQIPVRNYENEEVNDNRSWADIVEEELYQVSSQDGEEAAGHSLWADVMDEEINLQGASAIQTPAVPDDLSHNVPEPIATEMDEESAEEEFELDSLDSPVQAPTHLVESDQEEINDDINYGIPIIWADVVDVELQEEDLSVSSNPGHHHAEDTSAHPLSTDITQAELNLLPPPLLPVIAHNSHPQNKDVTEDKSDNREHTPKSDEIQEQESSSLAPNLQNQQQSQKSQDIEVDVPVQILCADEVKEEQRTTADNLTKTPAVQENLWENREKQDHPPTSSETFFANLEGFPDLASANPQGKTSKKRAKSMPKIPTNVKYVQELERDWKLATSQTEEEPKKSTVKSSTDKKQKKKATPHKTLQSEGKKKQKVMWSNLIMDDEQFPVLGSAKPQTRKKQQQKQHTTVQEQLIVQPVPLAQSPIVLPSNAAIATASETVANRMVQAEIPQKKKPRVQWSSFNTVHDERSLDRNYPIVHTAPVSSLQGLSFWRKPYNVRRGYYLNTQDKQQNRGDGNFSQEQPTRPPAEGHYTTKFYPRAKFTKPFRGGRWAQTESQGQRAHQRYEQGLENQPHHRHQERRSRWDEHQLRRSRTASPVKPRASKTKKDYTPAQSKQPKTYRPLENVRDSTLGVSKSENYGPPLQSSKPQRTTGSTPGKEPQKLKTPIRILKRPPVNVSNQDVTCKRSDYECKLMQSENTNKVSELDSQIKVTTTHCATQTIETQTDDVFLTDQTAASECNEQYNICESSGINTAKIAEDIGQSQKIAKGSKLSALSVEFVPQNTIELVNLKLKFRDGTIVEDEFIPEPVAPLPREDGSLDPAGQLQYLFEKREYFQARCRKLIQKHYPNEDISSKRPNETYEGMYNRLMQEETQRLYTRITTESSSSISISIDKTTETEDQRPPSSESRQRSQITKQEKINVTKVPEETNEQTIVSDIEEVTSEQVLYPEHSWQNDEEANRILDEQELQQTGWSAPVSHKRSKSKKTKSKDRKTEVACSKKKQSPKPSTSRNLEAQDEKVRVTERVPQVPEENISTSLLLMSTSSLNDLAMQDEEVNSADEVTDDKISWEVCPSRRSKSRKKSKSKKKKAQEVSLSVSQAADVNEEEVLIEPVPPTPMANGYIDPNDEAKFQIEQRKYFEARCKQLIRKNYPNVDINSKGKNETYEGMYKRLLDDEAKLFAELNKKSQKYYQHRKDAADKKIDQLIKDKPKSKRENKKSVVKIVSPSESSETKIPEVATAILEKDYSSDQDTTETLPRPEEFIFADDEEDTSSENSPKPRIQKRHKTRKDIIKNRADESEPEAPVRFCLSVLPKIEQKKSENSSDDELSEPEPPSIFFAPKEFLLKTEETPTTKSVLKKKSASEVKQSEQKKNKGKDGQDSDPATLSDKAGNKNKHVQFAEKVEEAVPAVSPGDVEEKLPKTSPKQIPNYSEANEEHLQDEAAAFPELKPETEVKGKRKSRKKRAVSAGEERVVPEDSGAKLKEAKSCSDIVTDKQEVKLTKCQRKRAKAKKKALLAKEAEGEAAKKEVDEIIHEEPKPPQPDENGYVDPDVLAKYEKDKKEFFQVRCKQFVCRDYPNVDINSKLPDETYEEMYNRLLQEERLEADRYFEKELRKLDALKARLNKYKSKKK